MSVGGHLLANHQTSAGPLDALGWFVTQFGKWGRIDHTGWATIAEAGWQPKALTKLRPWLRAGLAMSSGDDDPLDDTHKSFFQILPTPRPYARFPFYDMVNNNAFYGILTLHPHNAVTDRS